MATNTYVALQTQTLSSAVSSVTFSSIPQTYTDLVIVVSAKNTVAQNYGTWIRFNSDTGSNYSQTFIQNYANSTQSGRNSNIAYIETGKTNALSFDMNIIQINNYSNTTTNKTVLTRLNNADFVTGALVGLWRNTAAITRIDLICETGASYTAGSTFTLYGIAKGAEVPTTAKATGGTITYGIDYTYHVFTSSGTFTPTQALTCDYLVVAGGGGGNNGRAGGGAGGFRTSIGGSTLSATAQAYAITVGAGGAGGAQSAGTYLSGTKGSNSVFSTITSTGGGNAFGGSAVGNTGGSGSGAQGANAGGAGNEGGYSPVEGYAGGAGSSASSQFGGGGGGGASAVGSAGSGSGGGAGGAGSSSSITGTAVTYAGGGGGSGYNGGGGAVGGGAGGSGGGGAGTSSTSVAGTSGTANTGGGGGAGATSDTNISGGGSGGSGIVIIRYAN